MNTELRQSLLAELASLERQLQDPTLSNMDRDRLDQVWEDTHDRLDDLDGLFIAIPPIDDRVWRGASDFFADQPPTPPPSSPVRLALPPPPRFPSVPRTLSSHGVPPLSSTHRLGLHPFEWAGVHSPGPDEIPRIDHRMPSEPQTPRAWEPSEEDIERANNAVDDREGCARCAGCHYCRDDSYDGEGEV